MGNNEHIIKLQLRTVEQLFNSLDPSPFVGRDLDPAAEEFILSWAQEHPSEGAFKLHITVAEVADIDRAQSRVSDAVQSYFTASVGRASQEFSRLMRHGRFSLLVGILFLVGCFGASDALQHYFPQSKALDFVSEGLLIVCWVAMWQPLQIFLYEWWPLFRHKQLLQRLAVMNVEVVQG
ncbi:hypothetical protein [Pseudidiomarina gelatinasegens]|uniref:hypothetical protein n=1 Tax=Pseudidiomarina gelatinasegens TaxID=2487740 RepID=UPI003A984659